MEITDNEKQPEAAESSVQPKMAKKEQTRKKLLEALKKLWFAAVIVGAGYYFYRNYREISVYLETISLIRVGLSVLLVIIGKLALSDITRFSLKKVGCGIAYKDALTITSVTQLGKYLPGGIWHVAGKLGIYKARKISAKKATGAIVYENSVAVVLGGGDRGGLSAGIERGSAV